MPRLRLSRPVPFSILGLCILFLALSLLSYSATDPSLNHEVQTSGGNVMGFAGAVLADLLFQFFGSASWCWLFLGLAWLWRIQTSPLDKNILYVSDICWFPIIVVITIFLTLYVDNPNLPAGSGGIIGPVFATPLKDTLYGFVIFVLLLLLLWNCLTVALRTSLFSILQQVKVSLLRVLKRLQTYLHQQQSKIKQKKAWQRDHLEQDFPFDDMPLPPKVDSAQPTKKEPTIQAIEETQDTPVKKNPTTQEGHKKQEGQHSLEDIAQDLDAHLQHFEEEKKARLQPASLSELSMAAKVEPTKVTPEATVKIDLSFPGFCDTETNESLENCEQQAILFNQVWYLQEETHIESLVNQLSHQPSESHDDAIDALVLDNNKEPANQKNLVEEMSSQIIHSMHDFGISSENSTQHHQLEAIQNDLKTFDHSTPLTEHNTKGTLSLTEETTTSMHVEPSVPNALEVLINDMTTSNNTKPLEVSVDGHPETTLLDNKTSISQEQHNKTSSSTDQLINDLIHRPAVDNFLIERADDTVDDMVNNLIGDTIDDSVNNLIDDTVDDSVNNLIGDTTDDSVNNLIGDTTDDSVNNLIGDTIDDSINNLIGDTTDDSVNNLIGDTIDDSVNNLIGDTVDDAVNDLIGDTVDDVDSTELLLNDLDNILPIIDALPELSPRSVHDDLTDTLIYEMVSEVSKSVNPELLQEEESKEEHPDDEALWQELQQEAEEAPSIPDPSLKPKESPAFALPPVKLFKVDKTIMPTPIEGSDDRGRLEAVLLEYKIRGKVIDVQLGPVVTQYVFKPEPGVKINSLINIQSDLARGMGALSVRVAGNIHEKMAIGIEIPNTFRETVLMNTVLDSQQFRRHQGTLPIAIGVDISGRPVIFDLVKTPHLMVAGTTGSGKSVAINAMICSLLMAHSPKNLKLILIDPKMLELSMYADIPHLLVPVVTEPSKANRALAWAVLEMDRRYQLMAEFKVRSVESYNQVVEATGGKHEHFPYIVIVIDELADLMMVSGKEVEQSICRIAQKARAAGIHLIVATQRPSVDVITGLIKANLPSRLSFKVSTKIDSRTVLDQNGAEQLLGYGDSLFMFSGSELIRIHGAFVADKEVSDLAEHWKQQAEPEYQTEILVGSDSGNSDNIDYDERFDEAVALVVEKRQCSASMIQRHMRIGYNRASRIVECMENDGIVSAPGSGGIRQVMAPDSHKEESMQ